MFPTLSSIINYLLGTHYTWPLPTFGLFVGLAFGLSYWVFWLEFRRKERLGYINSFYVRANAPVVQQWAEAFAWLLLGFIAGFKMVGAVINAPAFWRSPFNFIFSWQGAWGWGAGAAILAAAGWYFIQQKQTPSIIKQQPKVLMHPYQLMPKLIVWAAICGFIGAKVFNYLENIEKYQHYSFGSYLQNSGLTFLGGLVFGAAIYFYIGHRHGMRLLDLADIGSPGMLVAYGVGRVGCHLSGDGDWGVVNHYAKPVPWLPDWLWSYQYPHNVLNAGRYIEGCSGNYCSQLPQGVFPTSLYEAIIILGCFAMLWLLHHRLRPRGLMFCCYLFIVSFERFFIEYIRVNYTYRVLGLQLTEAQIVSLLLFVLGLAVACYCWRTCTKKGQPQRG